MNTVAPKRSRLARLTSGLLAVALAGGLTLATAMPASAAPVATLAIAEGNNPYLPEWRYAQSFVAAVSGDLRTIVVPTGATNDVGSASLVTLVDDLPNGPVIATATSTRDGSTFTFTFGANVRVEAGQAYAFVFPMGLRLKGMASTYPSGTSYYSYQGTVPMQRHGNNDFGMTAYVEPRSTSPVAELTATSVAGAVRLDWTAGTALETPTGFGVSYRVNGSGDTWSDEITVTAPTATISGLTAGVTYEFSVRQRVDTYAAERVLVVATPSNTPSAPQGVQATAGDGTASVSWTAPADQGTSAITGYVISLTSSAGTVTTTGTSPATISGLVNGRSYAVTVLAANASGEGAGSSAVEVTPSAFALAPSLHVADADSALHLTWSTPTSDGSAITGYQVELDGVVLARVFRGNGSIQSGLENGASYDVRVRALNSRGPGAWSELLTGSPLTTPGAPVLVATGSGDAFASIDWDAPVDSGGRPVASYAVTVSSPGIPAVLIEGLTATEYTATGLENGRAYTLSVVALTPAGRGDSLVSDPLVPLALPGAPVITERIEGDELVGIRWSVPESDGSAITGYQVSYGTSDTTLVVVNTTDTEFTVPEANNGPIYEFRVRAINAAGTGAWSEPEVARARTVSDAPRNLDVYPSSRSVHLTWDAPAFSGGAPIDEYTIEFRAVGASAWSTAWAAASATDTYLFGVENGTEYEFRIAAVNVAGTGAFSEAVTAAPFAAEFTFTTVDGVPLDGARLIRGTEVVLAGTDFPVGSTIAFRLQPDTQLGTAVVGADGSVRIVGIIPEDIVDGSYELLGSVASQGETVSSAVTVQVVTPLVVVPTPDGELVVTGTDLGLGLGLGGLLVAAGIALTMIARRRSTATVTE